MSEEEDGELVLRTLAGDREAFGELYARHEKRLFNTAYRVAYRQEDASDAVHAGVVRAFEKLDSFDVERPFFPWIVRIVVNESLRLAGRRGLVAPEPGERSDPGPTPEDEARSSEIRHQISEALSELSAEYRAVITLRHIDGLSYSEMAEVLETPEKTVRSRLFTARQRLRQQLERRGCQP